MVLCLPRLKKFSDWPLMDFYSCHREVSEFKHCRSMTLCPWLWTAAGPKKIKAHVFLWKRHCWASLVTQWLRIRLPMQGTRVRALVREDPTCHRATKPVRHNYWACAIEPASHNFWSPCATTTEARVLRARAPATREATAMRMPCTTMKSSPCSPQLEKACTQQQRPNPAKNK